MYPLYISSTFDLSRSDTLKSYYSTQYTYSNKKTQLLQVLSNRGYDTWIQYIYIITM